MVAWTNTLTALTLAGVLVTNTYVEEVVQSLRKVVIVTTASMGAEVQITWRPQKFRPPVVELQEDHATLEVCF